MACTQARATSSDPAYTPLPVIMGSATRAPPGRSPDTDYRTGPAGDEDEGLAGVELAA
jgi:hypothetical protein